MQQFSSCKSKFVWDLNLLISDENWFVVAKLTDVTDFPYSSVGKVILAPIKIIGSLNIPKGLNWNNAKIHMFGTLTRHITNYMEAKMPAYFSGFSVVLSVIAAPIFSRNWTDTLLINSLLCFCKFLNVMPCVTRPRSWKTVLISLSTILVYLNSLSHMLFSFPKKITWVKSRTYGIIINIFEKQATFKVLITNLDVLTIKWRRSCHYHQEQLNLPISFKCFPNNLFRCILFAKFLTKQWWSNV